MVQNENYSGTASELENDGLLLRNTIDSSMDMIQVFRAVRNEQNEITDFRWILNNKAAEKIYGEVIGQSLLTLNPGVIETGIFETFKKVVETGEPDQSERHYVHEQFNGWFYQSTVKQGDGVVTTTRDITAAKKAEQKLRKNQEFLQTVINSSLDIIQVFEAMRNEKGEIIDFRWKEQNKNGLLQNGNVIGKHLLTLNPGVITSGIFNRMVTVTETGEPVEQEQYYSYEQFNERWFYQALVKQGDGVLMTTRDITAQKKAELEVLRLKDEMAKMVQEKYYSIFNSVGEGFCIFEMLYDEAGNAVDYIFIEVNPAFERQTGLKDVIGKTGRELANTTEPYWLWNYDRVVRTGEPVHFENYHEGTERWYQGNASRIGGPGSRLLATVFEDITERKRKEGKQAFLLKLNDALRELADPVMIQERAARILGEHLKVARAFYFTVEKVAGDYLQIVSKDYCSKPDMRSVSGRYPQAFWEKTTYAGLADGEALMVPDVKQLADISPGEMLQYAALGVQSLICVPLIRNGKYVAAFAVNDNVPRNWTAAELDLVTETAERTWAAVEKANIEEALRKSEEKYRMLFTSVDDGFCIMELIYDKDGKIKDLIFREQNPAFDKHTGLGDVVGKTVKELLPNFEQHWIDIYAHVAATGEVTSVENYVEDVGRWNRTHHLRLGEDGSPYVVAVFEDISERKRREQHQTLLSEISKELVALSSIASSMDWLGERIGKYFRAKWCRFSEPLGDGDQIVYEWHDQSVRPLKDAYYIQTEESKAGEITVVNDTKAEADAANYEAFNIHSYILSPLANEGQWKFQLALINDRPHTWRDDEIELAKELTARIWARLEKARAEEALRRSESVLNGQKEAFQTAMSGRTLTDSLEPLVSTVAGQMGGGTRAAFYIVPQDKEGLYLVAGMTETFAKDVNGFMVGPDSLSCGLAMHTGEAVITYDVEQEPRWEKLRAKAAEHGFRCSWSFPVRTNGGAILGTFAMYFAEPREPLPKELEFAEVIAHAAAIIISRHTELSERAQAENALRESEMQLTQLVRLRDEFIGNASHELKTPVTSIKTYAEVVQERLEETGDKENGELISRLNAQIDRLTALINHLLDTTKISEGQLRLSFEEFDLNEVLNERIDEIRRTTSHRFALQTNDVLPVLADRERIGQVIVNLLSNAIKYSPKGSEITVISRAGDNGVIISVKDEGCGIPGDAIEKIFQRFFRVRTKNMESFPGLGLGLYITAQIIRKHGGTISVQSEEGHGSTFQVVIPFKAQQE